MRLRRALVIAMLAVISSGARAGMSTAETARVEHLIRHVEVQHELKFVRNGTAYSCQEAARFLRGKLEKMGQNVTTAAQFIDQIASRSSSSGQPYLIRLADGRTVPAAQFLAEELKRMDRQR